MANKQVGYQLYSKRPPEFDNAIVRGGTWEEEDATKTDMNENTDEETFNVTAYDRGTNAKCEMFVGEGFALAINDVLDELATDENPDPQSWVVVAPLRRKRFSGSRAIIFEVNLINREALDTTQVS